MSRPDSIQPINSSHSSSSSSSQLPSVLTRSMSRKNLTTSSSNNNNIGLLRENIIRRPSSVKVIPSTGPHRTISSTSSRSTVPGSRSVAGTAPRRSILCELNDVKQPSHSTATDTGMFKASIRGRPRHSSIISNAVRTGPLVVAQRTSPTKTLGGARDSMSLNRDAAGDPFSLNFRPEIVVARAIGGSHKRGFEEEENSHTVDENGRREKKVIQHFSPAKRSHLEASDPLQMSTFNSGPFHFTSPTKKSASKPMSTTPKTAPPPSPSRQQYHQDIKEFDTMDTDIPASIHRPTHRIDHNYRNIDIPSSSPAPSLFSRKKHAAVNHSSDDEIDFLSPRKKPRSDNFSAAPHSQPRFPTSNSTSMLRSPPKKVPASPLKARISLLGATSVPMSRPSFALPPLPAFSRRPSTVTTPVLASVDQQTSIPTLPTVEPPFETIVPIKQVSSTTFAYGPSVGAGPRKSGIPRLIPTTTSTSISPILPPSPQRIQAPILPSIVAPLPTVAQSIFASYTAPTLFDSIVSTASNIIIPDESLDQTFNSTLDLDSTMGDLSTMTSSNSLNNSISNSSIGGMSDETAKRLAKLQSMLSKLQMPRGGSSSSLGGSISSTPSSSQETQSSSGSSRSGKMLPPMITNGVGKERKENLGRDRRRHQTTSSVGTTSGNFREEYTVPISGGELPQDANLATTMRRLERSTSSSRSHSTSYDSARSSIGMGPPPLYASSSNPTPSSSTNNGTMRPPRRTSVATGTSTAAISAAADGEGELSAKPKSNVLRGVVAFVDVRTLEGDDAGMIFVDMLKSMGARVTTRPTLTLTHIVYKSGRPGTLHRLRAHPEPKPLLVGISWVVNCCEKGLKVDEKSYLVESGNQPLVHKRRRSMEPKAFASLSSSLGAGGTTATDPTLKATIQASIERARRKSLQFQPRIGSPLAKRVFLMPAEETDDEEMS